MSRVAVIGAGAMGLAAAYHLLKAGHSVDVYEADRTAGGMAAHFDFDGLSLERFYHFICKSDRPTFELLAELGIADKMRWRDTSMGYFYRGKVHRWGDPLALLLFPHLSLISKIRYGLHVFTSTKRSDWTKLDRIHADDWVRRWGGEEVWKVLWEKLFTLKFFEYSHDISAAWIWTRLKRVGTSRRHLFQEELGYIEGGSETLVDRLVERIQGMGGRLHLGAKVEEIVVADNAVSGVRIGGTVDPVDAAIATVPMPFIVGLVPALTEKVKQQYDALRNIGVVCVVHRIAKSISPHFWLNINDDAMAIPGIVEFSRLRDVGGDTIVYVPYYMPTTHPKFSADSEFLIRESFDYLKRIQPALTDQDRKASAVGRLRYAQPVCPPRFLESLPPVVSSIRGLQIADTSTYYPEDRGISESVRIAREMAERVA